MTTDTTAADVDPAYDPADYPASDVPLTDRIRPFDPEQDPDEPSRPGDLCRGLALAIGLGSSPTAFAAANGALDDATFSPTCDTLAWTELDEDAAPGRGRA